MSSRRFLYWFVALAVLLLVTGGAFAQGEEPVHPDVPSVDGENAGPQPTIMQESGEPLAPATAVEAEPQAIPVEDPALSRASGWSNLVREADAIVVGTVGRVRSYRATNEWGDQLILSDVTILMEETLKGNAGSGRKLVLRGVEGGTTGGRTMMSSDAPLFTDRERIVLLLRQIDNGQWGFAGGDLGKIAIDASGGIPQLGITLDGLREGIGRGPDGEFLWPADDALLTSPAAEATASALTGPTSPAYVLSGMRWFGAWPIIDYRINNPGFNDASAGSLTAQNNALRQGANDWGAVGGANFEFRFAGTSTITPVSGDGERTVIVRNAFNPAGQSILATAYRWGYPSTGQMTDCDIVFWDRNVFTTALILEVARHEFGHCLGLGHSLDTGAVMYEYANGADRLQHDDINGLRHLYDVGSLAAWSTEFTFARGWRVAQHPRFLADVNGDGRDDVVGFGNAGVIVGLSNGSSFGTSAVWLAAFGYNAGGWRVDQHPRMMADVNGDGRADVVGFAGAGIAVATAKSQGTGFNTPSVWNSAFGYNQGWRVDRHPRYLVDVNGDGRDDVVGFGDTGVYVSTSNGASFGTSQRWSTYFSYNGNWRTEYYPRLMADVNGDGRDDVIGFGSSSVYVATSTGTSFGTPAVWSTSFAYNTGWRVDLHPRMMADVNNDGRADIVGFGNDGVYVATSTGTSFRAPARWSTDYDYNSGWRVAHHPRYLTDVNGDGRADVVGFASAGVSVAPSTGTGFEKGLRWVSNYGYNAGSWRGESHPRLMGDVNGDGRADVVGFASSRTYVSRSVVPPGVFR